VDMGQPSLIGWLVLARPLCYVLLAFVAVGCYETGEAKKSPPPGYAGGFCLAPTSQVPDPHCSDGSLCNLDGAYCFDAAEPCRGFFCGGSDAEERGICQVDELGLPRCVCALGYDNVMWELFCCRTDGFDEKCGTAIEDLDEALLVSEAPLPGSGQG
jgi:hypothetical protein